MFIESVRARATCNTIISSHPVSSHRPCTNSFLLSVHASHSFSLLIFFFYFSLTHSPSSILIYFYFPFHIIIQFASSHPVRFFRTKILSLRSLPPWISLLLFLLLYILSHFFPCHSFPSSLFSFHPPSSSYFHATRVYSFLPLPQPP